LIKIQANNGEQIRFAIVRFIRNKRKSDYRFFDENWTGKEKTAWKKAVSLTIDQGKHKR
jgi:hypothetical protein